MGSSYTPTAEQRRVVKRMAAYGVPVDQIARSLNLGLQTVKREFKSELELGTMDATMEVADTLLAMAKSGAHPAATFFWLKNRAGWKEAEKDANSGATYTVKGGLPDQK
jgi:hypothetical protein